MNMSPEILINTSKNYAITILIIFGVVFAQFMIDGESNQIRISMAFLLIFILLPLTGAIFSFMSTTLLIVLIEKISSIKESTTGKPLSIPDIAMGGGEGNLLSYANHELIWIVFFLLLSIGAGFAWNRKYGKPYCKLRWSLSAGALAFLCFVLSGSTQATKAMQTFGAQWVIYDELANKRTNGVVAHLIFTGRDIVVPSKGKVDFARERNESIGNGNNPDIFAVMCEACFTDPILITAMSGLTKHGFIESKLMSPVYGGGTSEAEFEFLTGLSSRVLPENDYQVYGDKYRNNMDGLPKTLKSVGYETHAMHNFKSWFWKRNIIYPKLGFDKIAFIDSMNMDGDVIGRKGDVLKLSAMESLKNGDDDIWPSDRVLYKKAIESYKSIKTESPQFFFLVTVMTHGPYSATPNEGNAYGEIANYKSHIKKAMIEFEYFVQSIESESRKKGKESVFVIFGDHKPGITKAFIDMGIFDSSYIKDDESYIFNESITKDQNRNIFSVPLFVKSSATGFDGIDVAKRLDGKPIFCLGAEMERASTAKDSFFSAVREKCESPDKNFYTTNEWARNIFPTELIANRLF